MSFEKIISIPGQSGLYKMLAQMRNGGFVVESLTDGKRVPVSSTQRIIMLNDIAVYTVEDDIPLREVFLKMKEQEKVAASVDPKMDPEKLKSTLKKILPDFDEERVHASDIRKMFAWFNVLNGQVDFNEMIAPEKAEEKEAITEETDVAEAKEVKKPKKTAAKKSAAEDKTKEAKKTAASKKTAAKKSAPKEVKQESGAKKTGAKKSPSK